MDIHCFVCVFVCLSAGDLHRLSEVRIVLLGCRGAGKSSAGNTILGREEFDLRGSAQCVMRQGEVAGRKITVVEAPGWQRDKAVQSLKQEIELSVSMCPPGPHAVLLVMRLDFEFTEKEREELVRYVDLLGSTVWSHTIVLFTFGDSLGDTTIERHIESEGQALQRLVEKCGNRYHVFNNKKRDDDSQVTEMLEKIEEMVAENKGCPLETDIMFLQNLKVILYGAKKE
ncbi:GTPase IMAP family member 9-like [Hemibagrus wyckioides]|uniref:GTPase IMAP family member 9-like n=1 Tax=Hemibagrus wyckioides TaxID=337641 RepID=UPI00266C402A|nr:GTPase IMAP family member 9-like [Hemibagrus wyckioides]